MKTLIQSNDPVRLSWVTAYLADAGIEVVMFDLHTSVLEGSIGILPRRLVVHPDDYNQAKRLLIEAGDAMPDDFKEEGFWGG
ncbi:MAG: DUF2007 domain-containing protein [Alphaproteobacteria bacterium]|nr:DUF2007 domain-containing protein [Alphaproteobacteria bacterium]